jgi:hypothetical protein
MSRVMTRRKTENNPPYEFWSNRFLQDCGGSLKNKSILKNSGEKNEEFPD